MLNTIKTEDGLPEREEIEQVRRLLFGEMQEANQRRMDVLEASLAETRTLLERQIAALGSATTASQASLIKEIGVAISSLGHRIAGLADGAVPQQAAAAPSTFVFTHSGPDVTEPVNAASAATGAQDHE